MTFANNYFSRRWRGQVPLAVLFWRDTLVIGTLANLTVTFLAVLMLVQGVPVWFAVLFHLLLLPYNVFLCVVLWRMPDRNAFTTLSATGWLIAMTLV